MVTSSPNMNDWFNSMIKRLMLFSVVLCLLLSPYSCRSVNDKPDLSEIRFADLCQALIAENDSATVEPPRPLSLPENDQTAEDVVRKADLSRQEALHRLEEIGDHGEPCSLELRWATLSNAINLLSETAEVNVLLKGDFSERIDVSLPQVSLGKIFVQLLEVYDCHVEQQDDLFIVTRDDPNQQVTRHYQLKSISAATVEGSLQALIGELDKVVTNEATDIVTVTAPRETQEHVAGFIRSVDHVEQQVLIEAKIIEFSLNDLFELGAQLSADNIHLDDTTATFATDLLTASQGVNVTAQGDKALISGALRMLSQFTRVNVISHPNVLAKNEQAATIDIIEEIPYVESTVTTTGDPSQGVGSSAVETVEFKEVGIKLKVTPSIMKNGCITLAIDQDVSEHIDTFNGVPVVNHRHIITTFTVLDRKTILIGGLLKEFSFDEEEGVPLLMDMPLLGFLFRGTTRRTEKVELVVMITSSILDPKEGAGLVSQYRMDLPNMQADSPETETETGMEAEVETEAEASAPSPGK